MPIKLSKWRRVLSLAICLLFVLGMIFSLSGTGAEALQSLPNIERIKQQGGAFRILEILPDGSQGSIGYLLKGQEPIGDWTKMAASLQNRDDREEKINDLISKLKAKGLLASGDTAPLKNLGEDGEYKEYLPWEVRPEGTSTLELNFTETVKGVRGKFEKVENGAYKSMERYEIAANGTHIQDIAYFTTKVDGNEENYYWYAPEFTEITEINDIPDGTPVYINENPDSDHYVYKGTKGQNLVNPTPEEKYYYVTDTGTPSEANKAANKIYAAASSGFIQIYDGQTGYFNGVGFSYFYVGSEGDCNYIDADIGDHTISYDTVYYTGGIENNEWFLRHVFDWEEAESKPAIIIDSVSVNELDLRGINSASLIVISNGLALEGAAQTYSGDRDIEGSKEEKDTPYGRILELCKPEDNNLAGRPVVVDKALCSGNLKINGLAAALCGENAAAHVSEKVYCAEYPLVNSSFAGDFGESEYKNTGTPFYEVYRQIDYENYLRGEGAKQLPMKVNPAASLRHIIAGSRGQEAKDVINVLEIQPGKSPDLSKEEVCSWLGINKPEVISITTQSTSEFIGKIEPLSQTYDLIYIGSNTVDFKTATVNGEIITKYDDGSMDGLIYTNIGDTVRSGRGNSRFSLSGLLDRDYADSTFNSGGKSYNRLNAREETTRTFRLSGNDLTNQKLQELQEYADSGYPVILANNLYSSITADNSGTNGNFTRRIISYDYTAQLDISPNKLQLTAVLKVNGLIPPTITQARYEWYKVVNGEDKAIDGAIGESLNITDHIKNSDEPIEFYCKAYAERATITSSQQTTTNKPAISNRAKFKGNEINENRVDNSSLLYELLDKIEGKPNVMPIWQTEKNQDYLNKSANLQKPEIVFAKTMGVPEPYKELGGLSLSPINEEHPESGYELCFRFHLINDGDPDYDPYECRLYVDMNGDGRYTDDERMYNLEVYEWDIDNGVKGKKVADDKLQIGTEYIASRRLPLDMMGIIPWKLGFEKTTDPKTTCYQTGYTHIKPNELETINILQINTADNAKGKGLNLEENETFQQLFNDVQEKNEFDINLMTVGAAELEGILASYKNNITPGGKDKLFGYLAANDVGADADLFDILNSFDMLILGFGDSYQGISADSAKAIAGFIGTGKAVLFSHDCSSYYFLPLGDYKTNSLDPLKYNVYSSSKTVGYEFNMAIRDAVGLDRYGITNPVFGITKYAPVWLRDAEWNGIVASQKNIYEIKESDKTILDRLQAEGYSIAYKPNSNRKQIVPETQGLSSGLLMRFYQGGGTPTGYDNPTKNNDNLEEVTEIRQVNSGQITSYPYNINTEDFGGTVGSGNKMTVMETHSQYQQLNLNSDDIVVWYCLAGGSFENSPNDVINDYYLYSRGNVTYTGFGHIKNGELAEDGGKKEVNKTEAKLFVNTMIAAHRTAKPIQQIKFTDETGEKGLESFLMPSDNGKILKTGAESDKTRRIYFNLSDLNVGTSQPLFVSFSYVGSDDTVPLTGLEIYDALSKEKVYPDKGLPTENTYYIKLDDVLKQIGTKTTDKELYKMGSDGISLNAAASLGAGGSAVSSATLILRKLDLLKLS